MLFNKSLFTNHVSHPHSMLVLSVPRNAKQPDGSWAVSKLVGWHLPADTPVPTGFPRDVRGSDKVHAVAEKFGADVMLATVRASKSSIGAARATRTRKGSWYIKAYTTNDNCDLLAPPECGAPTRNGGQCHRHVSTAGERCWQHR